MDGKLANYSKAGTAALCYEAAESRIAEDSITIELHKWQRFSVGAKYEGGEGWDGWYYCTAEGISGWVPESIIDFDGSEVTAKKDYSSFELSIVKGEKLRGISKTGGWIWCENFCGEHGWVPDECLKAVEKQS